MLEPTDRKSSTKQAYAGQNAVCTASERWRRRMTDPHGFLKIPVGPSRRAPSRNG